MTGFRKRKLLGILLVAVMILGLFPGDVSAAPYSDIKGHWAEELIEGWLQVGFAAGYPDGTFRPNQPVTWAEIVTLANRALGIKAEGGEEVFSDVPAGAWYFAEVAAANKAGYISCYTDGTFQPSNTITRQEMAVVIAQLLGLKGTTGGDKFSDHQEIAPWAKEAVEAVYAAGIMVGYPDGAFRPENFITRAESLVTISNAYEAGEPLEAYVPEEGREEPVVTGKIEVISVEPDKDLVPDEETEFKIIVDYEFDGIDEAVIYVGFNTEQVDGCKLVGRHVVKEKVGSHTFKVKALVKDWGENESFVAYVNISEYPHPYSWNPLDTDVHELKIVEADSSIPE
jgi:hypothetical protein